MKPFFLTLIIFLIIFRGDASTFNKKENAKESFILNINGSFNSKKQNDPPVDEIQDNDFIISTLEEKVNYQTIKNRFTLVINSERSFQNKHDKNKTDREINVSLSNNFSTNFSYYLTDSKNIFLKGIIYTDKLILSKGVKVGMNRTEIGQIFNCTLDITKNKFKIYDIDGLIEVILNFDPSGNIAFIEINSGYIS